MVTQTVLSDYVLGTSCQTFCDIGCNAGKSENHSSTIRGADLRRQ